MNTNNMNHLSKIISNGSNEQENEEIEELNYDLGKIENSNKLFVVKKNHGKIFKSNESNPFNKMPPTIKRKFIDNAYPDLN